MASRLAAVDVQCADRDRARGLVGLTASAEHGAQPGLELRAGVRLDQVVVGARVEEADDLGVVVTRGCDDHRHRGHAAQHAQGIGTVDVGEPEIEHRRGRDPSSTISPERIDATCRGAHRVATRGQRSA